MEPFTLPRRVRELDRRAIEEFGVPGIVLMENAGRGCAELLMRLNPDKKPVVILCGPGNNGGDGFVIARHLTTHGWPVSVYASTELHNGRSGDSLAAEPKLAHDAARNYILLRRGHPVRLVSPANLEHGSAPVATRWFGEIQSSRLDRRCPVRHRPVPPARLALR